MHTKPRARPVYVEPDEDGASAPLTGAFTQRVRPSRTACSRAISRSVSSRLMPSAGIRAGSVSSASFGTRQAASRAPSRACPALSADAEVGALARQPEHARGLVDQDAVEAGGDLVGIGEFELVAPDSEQSRDAVVVEAVEKAEHHDLPGLVARLVRRGRPRLPPEPATTVRLREDGRFGIGLSLGATAASLAYQRRSGRKAGRNRAGYSRIPGVDIGVRPGPCCPSAASRAGSGRIRQDAVRPPRPSAISCGPRWETARRTRAASPRPAHPDGAQRSWRPWSRTSTRTGRTPSPPCGPRSPRPGRGC